MLGFINNIADALVLILLFSVTIFVHELSHFLVAIRLGLVVETFSIGFGPSMWQRKRNGILYKIGWIPFGGYVALPQLDPAGMSTIQGSDDKKRKKKGGAVAEQEADPRRELPDVSPWKRLAVAASGVVGNIILAIILAWVVYWAPDAETPNSDAVIGYVEVDSAAYEAGLRVGDRIVSVGDEAINTWHDFNVLSVLQSGPDRGVLLTVETAGEIRSVDVPTEKGEMGEYMVRGLGSSSTCLIGATRPGSSAEAAGLRAGDIVLAFAGERVVSLDHFIDLVSSRGGQECPVVVRREGKDVELTVTPEFDEQEGRALIGVELSVAEIGVLPWMRYKTPGAQIRGDATEILRILKALVTPKQSRSAAGALGGPVMIITWLWVSIKISIFNAVGFLRFLNVNLAILNLLPFPVLDGGHIVFCLWEGITRRRVHPKLVNVLVNVFATLLIGVFVLLTMRDFLRAPKMFRGLRALLGNQTEQVETNTVPEEASSMGE